ncbi:MAG TPA: FG-GAP-like repeat-containing protein [Bacteroidia bacterium]|jgi:hypothetical protein|nr:FG-GAP-like repeat-containing protein [Bacteroidia bacterium]
MKKYLSSYLFFLLICFTKISFSQICFNPAITFQADSMPYLVICADFNADGITDIATPNNKTNNVAVLLGTGTGSFGATNYFPAGSGPISITSADFNHDAKPDIAVANAASNNMSVLLGNGTGSFGTQTTYTSGNGPSSITNGEFNGDGNIDLVVTNYDGSMVSVFLGDGAGGFTLLSSFPASVSTNVGPNYVITTDFNADGKADLAIANWDGNDISLFLGNGNGSFGTPSSIPCNNKPCAVVSADFNGDGKPDLAASNYFSNDVSVLLGNGNGGFSTAVNYAVQSKPYSITSADFNLDGRADIAVNNENSNSVSVLLGNGTGAFGIASDFLVGQYPESIASADFNGDGKPDIASADYHSQTVSILLNTILPPVVAHANADTICAGNPLILTGSGAATYTWTGGATNGVAFPAAATTTYTVTGTNSDGCTNKDTVRVIVSLCAHIISSGSQRTSLVVFPNPANEDVVIELIAENEQLVKITDITGNTIFFKTLPVGKSKIDVRNFPAGVYTIAVFSNEDVVTRRLLICR